ncbi:MAG: hypothetical protein HC801_04855 [Nitrospira sp.]|nr:hypothetical protein [Nitrospira sp.]
MVTEGAIPSILDSIMNIEIGSNLYQNTNGTIEVEGVPQIQLARHPATGALLVNFALFDSAAGYWPKWWTAR